MKLVARPVSGEWLRNCLHACEKNCSRVRAAIAYADGGNIALLESCDFNDKTLDFYGRYDHTVPIDPSVLRWFIDKASISLRCHLVPDFLHAKVIWWVDAGAYIGSANLTDRAWNKNYEAGCFFTQEELVDHGIDEQLAEFFEGLSDHSHPLTAEILKEQEDLSKALLSASKERLAVENSFEKNRLIKVGKNPGIVSTQTTKTKHQQNFIREWNSTLQVMRGIAQRVSSDEHRPHWIPKTVPAGAQADQFLHAFYYQHVRDGIQYPVEKYYEMHQESPDRALSQMLSWWKEGSYDHQQEKIMLTEWAPVIQRIFSKENIGDLTEEQWIEAGSKIHAIRDYAGKHSSADLGSPDEILLSDQKARQHCRMLWLKSSSHGNSVRDLIKFVVWGEGQISDRLWKAKRSEEWQIDGIGISALGELVGWSRPSEFPPRNKRTSKGLRALGYPVLV